MFRRKRPDLTEKVVARLESVLAGDRGLGARLFRTAAGWRVLVTTRTYDPASEESTKFLEALGSDPLYVRLCRSQNCYRARLTPKCWRCGIAAPGARFPFDDPRAESAYRAWVTDYARRAERFATCRPLGAFGDDRVDPAVSAILDVHDQYACTGLERLA